MKSRTTIASLVLVSMISAGTLFAGEASAKETVNLHHASVAGAPSKAQLATTNANVLAPQGVSAVTLINGSPFTIYIFVNGVSQGFLYPGHYLPVYVESGYTVLTARADFINAPSLFWNSGSLYYYPGGSYSWTFR